MTLEYSYIKIPLHIHQDMYINKVDYAQAMLTSKDVLEMTRVLNEGLMEAGCKLGYPTSKTRAVRAALARGWSFDKIYSKVKEAHFSIRCIINGKILGTKGLHDLLDTLTLRELRALREYAQDMACVYSFDPNGEPQAEFYSRVHLIAHSMMSGCHDSEASESGSD